MNCNKMDQKVYSTLYHIYQTNKWKKQTLPKSGKLKNTHTHSDEFELIFISAG